MPDQNLISGYLNFLKANYPLPKFTRLSLEIQNTEDFKYNKSWFGACKRVSLKNFQISIRQALDLDFTLFTLGHEYKHVLQFCYEGMNKNGIDAKTKGLGYHYRQWEIPANYFAKETLASYKASLESQAVLTN